MSMAKMTSAPGFLIDGFPANMEQAELFMSRIQAPHKIILLEVPEQVMSQRLKDGVNFNDQDDTIKKRIFTYLEHTKPTIECIMKKWKAISKIVKCLISKHSISFFPKKSNITAHNPTTNTSILYLG